MYLRLFLERTIILCQTLPDNAVFAKLQYLTLNPEIEVERNVFVKIVGELLDFSLYLL